MVGKLLLVLGVAALLAGGLGLYAQRTVLDTEAFADRATAALAEDEVREEVAARLADREIETMPELAPRRPVLEAAIDDLVEDPRFPAVWRAGAVAMHRALLAGREVQLALPGAGRKLKSAVDAPLPAGDPTLMRLGGGPLEDGLVRAAPWGPRLASLAPFALLAAAVLLAGAAWRASTRRRGARRVAFGLALAGGVIVAATTIARAILLSTFDTGHGDAVVGTIWDAYLGDLRLWGLGAGALGLVAAAILEPGTRGAWRRTVAAVAAPRGAGARLARAGGLAVLAALLLWMPEVPLDLALVSGAGVLVFTAVAEVVRISSAR
ncbi:MAG TPA: hypothetical protein VFZ00_20450 [Solirubrobacter sp.]|nr:hypothetical protein [Solirubrobacter sp.]